MTATSDTGRVEAFSDGVLAVAITLLALNLRIGGQGSLAHQLAELWPSYAAYLVSFFTIGIIWVNHHDLFKNFARVDRTLLFLNLLLLCFVVLIPFATSTIATYLRSGRSDGHLAAALYGAVLEGMGLCFFAIFAWSIHRGHLREPLSKAAARAARRRFGAGNLVYLVAIAAAFLSARLALALYASIAIYYTFEQAPVQSKHRPKRDPGYE